MVYFFSNFIRYRIFLLATFQTVLLHRTIYVKTLVGVEFWLPWTCVMIIHFLFCFFSLFCWSILCNPLLASHHVPELGTVYHLDSLLYLFNLVFLSFRVLYFFKHFLPIFQSLPYGNPGEKKLVLLLTAGSCCTGSFAYMCVSFGNNFIKQSCTKKNSIKMHVEKQAFLCLFHGGL
jgi:hypothetical protein